MPGSSNMTFGGCQASAGDAARGRRGFAGGAGACGADHASNHSPLDPGVDRTTATSKPTPLFVTVTVSARRGDAGGGGHVLHGACYCLLGRNERREL
jgi:hypothetical protein